jgi:hypothetical protein
VEGEVDQMLMVLILQGEVEQVVLELLVQFQFVEQQVIQLQLELVELLLVMVMVYKERVQYFHQLHQQVEDMVVEELVLVH